MGFTPPVSATIQSDAPAWGETLSHERALLGALLHDSALIPPVAIVVAAENFSTAFHERLFEALVGAHQTSGSIDVATLGPELGTYAWDAEGGSAAALARLLAARAEATDAEALAFAIAAHGRARANAPLAIAEDVVAWTHRQADLLSRLATRTDDLSRAVDWASVIEEVLHVGRSQTSAVVRKIELVFEHLLKLISDPDAVSRNRWRIEVEAWRKQIAKDATAAMRQLIDLYAAWQKGRDDAAADLADYATTLASGVPDTCPFTFDELRAKNSTMADLYRLLGDRMNAKLTNNFRGTSR